MEALVQNIKKLPYFSGELFEKKILEILKEHNIRYEYQPNGSQKFPDFILPDYSISLECKSSIGTKPMWNCSYPKLDSIYVFSSKKLNKTLVFFGKELVTQEIIEIYEEYSKKHKILAEEINNKLLRIQDNNYGMKVYPRNMFTQTIGFDKTLEDYTKEYKPKPIGQYFTISKDIQYKLLDDYTGKFQKILEPSCGIGHLINLVYNKSKYIKAYDIDGDVISICKELYPKVKYIRDDFLSVEEKEMYDLIIANPPYFEINREKVHEQYLPISSGRVNIYYLFLYKCVNLLEKDGELRAIIPKAFLSNSYAEKTRRHISKYCTIIGIDFFKSNLFDNASQNVIILKCKRNKNLQNKHELYLNNSLFYVKDMIKTTGITVGSLGCTVKTGNIIWNENKHLLVDYSCENSLKLYYSSDISQKNNKNDNKKPYLKITQYNKKYIIHDSCILVQRIFSTDIVFKYVEKNINGFFVENHINVISGPEDKLKIIYSSFLCEDTKKFINNVFNNNQISKTELENILQIYQVE